MSKIVHIGGTEKTVGIVAVGNGRMVGKTVGHLIGQGIVGMINLLKIDLHTKDLT